MSRPGSETKLKGMAISDTSIKQPVFITMVMLAVITFGILAFRTTPVNLLPDFDVPVIAITVAYPGANPESVAEQVAKPIEDEVNTVSNLDHITSDSSEGIAVLILEFTEGTDIQEADRSVREKVDLVLPTLPRDVRDPIFQQFDPNTEPIMSIAVGSNAGQSSLELRRLVEDDIVPRLQRADGVGSVSVSGGQTRQINVLMDLSRLQTYQILPSQIVRSLEAANANLGLGSIETSAQSINLRAPSMLQTPDDIARIQITGTAYRVGDVATIEDGVADEVSYSRLDGNEAIIVDIRKRSGTNTVQVADNVYEQIGAVFANRADLNYIVVRDDSEDVRSAILSSIEELIFAALAAFAVVWLFFRNLRSTLITMSGLPVIIIGTFIFMPFFDLTINLISLLALSLCVGLVIDDAIVVRENIFRHMERGEGAKVAASKGTVEVALSVLAMTLTIVAVFVPVTFAQGTAGIVFQSFGLIVAIAILLSLVEAFTLAPMLSANIFQRKRVQESKHEAHQAADVEQEAATVLQNIDEESLDAGLVHEAQEDPGWMGRVYQRLLAGSLRTIMSRALVVLVAVAVLVASFYVASGLKFSFFPEQDPHEFIMGFEMPPGTVLEQTDALASQAEAILVNDPLIESTISTVGFSGNPERAEFYIKLVGRTPTLETQERLREELAFLPRLSFTAPSFGIVTTAVSGRELQISLQSTRSLEEMAPLIPVIEEQMRQVEGLVDIDTNYRPGKTELRFIADPVRIGDLGLTNNDIATSVRALINGDEATVLRQDGQDTEVVVRLREQDRSTPEAIRDIIIPTQSGPVPLSSLGQVEISSSPTTIRRYDRLNQILIGANLENRNLTEAQAELQQRLDTIGLPDDVTRSFVGQLQEQTEGFDTLLLAMGLSVLFVYMVLASQFGSFTQPIVIMMAMPFSFIGAFLALRLVGIDLDITGMIGLIMLLGLVVKNSILLVDFTNRLRRSGMSKHAALELAGAIRLRPILMTTFSLVAGALPIALGIHVIATGDGSEFRRGLAIVLIGGLLTSTVLTLLVVPTAYSLMESLTERFSRWFGLESAFPTPQPAMVTASAGSPGAPSDGVVADTVPAGRSVEQPSAPNSVGDNGRGEREDVLASPDDAVRSGQG